MPTIDFDACPCSGKNMSTLVAPWILLTLYHHQGTHGYEIQKMILSQLQELDLGLNMTGLYRHLNLLEKRGVLTLVWDTDEPGPAKRGYHLTEAGKEGLWRWIGTLGLQLTLIGKFLDEANKVFPQAILPRLVMEQDNPDAARACRIWKEMKLNNTAYALGAFGLVPVAWQVVAVGITAWRNVPFPTPWTTGLRLIGALRGDIMVDHTLFRHAGDSLGRWIMAFGMAAAAGVAFGLIIGWWRPVEQLTMPVVHILQLVPGLAWIPVAILTFGVGEKATFFMIALTVFAPVVINVVSGVKQVDVMLLRAARMLGAGRSTLFFRVLLPGALPQIIAGLRVGLGNGWRFLVAAEMIVGTGTGLGYAIVQARWTLDYAAACVCIIVICLVGLATEHLVFLPLEKMTVERWGLVRGDL
jgi:ABC-type nitrate/sulfonate/bicarbonate transport system permease component/DNA-binding PadR family transcriptional regulator